MSLDQAGKRREALVVLGMHRSGAAAVARLLSLAGAGLPKPDVEAAGDDLPEPRAVVELNDKILADLGASWSDPFGPRDARTKQPPLDRYLDEAREALRSSFEGEDFVVLKEPRISLFVDFWKAALRLEGFEPRFIIVVRHPLEVAQSLRTLHGFSRDRSLMMWATYMLAAERGTRGEKRLFLGFDDLLADPEAALEKIEAGLTVALPRRSWDARLDIEQQIKPDQRHHIVGDRKITAAHLSGIEKLYDHFDAASRGQPRNIDVTDEVGAWLTSIEQTTGGLIKEEERRRKTAEAEAAELTEMRDRLRARERDLEWQIGVWTERAQVADARAEALDGDLAGARAAIDVLRQHHETQLADLGQAQDARLLETDAKLRDAEARGQDAETRAGEAELRLQDAEANLREAERRLNDSEARARAAELRLHDSEVSVREADIRLHDSEADLREAERRLRDAEANLREVEQRMRDSEASVREIELRLSDSETRAREAELRLRASEASVREAEAALRDTETRVAEAWKDRLADLERTHRARASELETAVAAAERARLAAEAGLSAVTSASTAERVRLEADLREARQRAEAEIASANARIETAGVEARAARNQSSDLARELTAVIADRGQFRKYSAAELQLAVLRRLWPFR